MHKSGEQQMYSWRQPQQQFSNQQKSSNATRAGSSLSALSSAASTAASAGNATASICGNSVGAAAERSNSVEVASATDYGCTDTVVRRSTPILFSTNRGLHLRVAKPLAMLAVTHCMGSCVGSTARARAGRACTASAYDIQFCDLERWNTRANAVSLEDTFTISQPRTSIFQRSSISQMSLEST